MKKLLSIFLLVLTIMPTSSAVDVGGFGVDPAEPEVGGFSIHRSFRAVNPVDNSYVSPINSVNVVESNNTYNSDYNYHYNAENTQVLRPVAANPFGNTTTVNNTWKYKSFTQRNTNSYKAYHRNNNYARPTRYYYTSVYYYTPVTYYYSW